MGIEPTSKAWEALILPMNYARLLLESNKQLSRLTFPKEKHFRHVSALTKF